MPKHTMSISTNGTWGRCVLDGIDITHAVLRDEITLTPDVGGWRVSLTLMIDELDLDVSDVDVIAREAEDANV